MTISIKNNGFWCLNKLENEKNVRACTMDDLSTRTAGWNHASFVSVLLTYLKIWHETKNHIFTKF